VSTNRVEAIEHALRQHLEPTQLLVKDQSHLHAGHAGAQDGRGHFEVIVISKAFAEKNRLARHRMVYAALGDLMQTDIHALSVNAYTPDERAQI